MSSLQPFLIAGSDVGLETDKEAFLLPDKAYPRLQNAYVWRDRVKKREGLEFMGRLRRIVENQAQANADGTSDYDIADILSSFTANEPNAEIEIGSLVITIDGTDEFTDQGDGTLLRTAGSTYQITTGTYINYATGAIHIEWDAGGTPANGISVTTDFYYFPALPVMGIIQRETGNINFEETIFFDQRYAYTYDGTDFSEYLPATSTTWGGSDSEFFWGANYRGSDASVKYLFVTNFDNSANSPMRYTDASTWTDFAPAVGGTNVSNEGVGTLIAPWNAFAGNLANTPIVPGSVTITVSNGTDPDVIFTDQAQNGTLSGFADTNSGTIDYDTGAIALTISPAMTVNADVTASYQYEVTYMWSARLLLPYYGRFLAFDTWEGTSRGVATQFFNRVRFSQVGDPTQTGAWVSTVFGKGGFIDAPTDEEIISAIFYKNTLIVFFERTTWELRYVGDYGLPFTWERVSSDYGSESQFSTILFDEGVLAVGDRAVITASSQDVRRIDEKIPDLVFSMRNDNHGKERVQGVRDYRREIVYWCYNDATNTSNDQKYPTRTLVFNYRNNTYAIFRNNVTAYGTYQGTTGITWDSTTTLWDDYDISWDTVEQISQFPFVVCGNQEGYVHKYNESQIDEKSLSIAAIDRSVTPPLLTVYNHNLLPDEIIYIEGMQFIDTTTSVPEATGLNGETYQVYFADGDYNVDQFSIRKWNTSTQLYESDFSYTPANGTGTYIGGGEISLLPKMSILTKDFNPFLMRGKQMKLSYIDFLTEQTSTGIVTIKLYADTIFAEQGNLIVGQTTMNIQQNPILPTNTARLCWNRFFSTYFGQFISVEITYNDDQMNDRTIYDNPYTMSAMIVWAKEGGRLV